LRPDARRKVIWRTLDTLCRRNRVQQREEFIEEIAVALQVSRPGVGAIMRAMMERGWIEIYKGKRKNSRYWVRYTELGRKEWKKRV
jgi:DNA-binding MarR family transcriptional regulator